MKLSIRASTFILVIFSAGLFTQDISKFQSAYYSIKKDELYSNLKFLASDSLKGRATGTEENNLAAKFIAEKFQKYGLIPLIDDLNSTRKSRLKSNENLYSIDDYFQRFNIIKSKISSRNYLDLKFEYPSGEKIISFNYKDDFIVQANSNFNNLSIYAPVVFAGYGINKGEKNYNDYLNDKGEKVDVKGKIVLIVDGFPQERNSESEFSKSKNALYRNPLRKMEVASELGAMALIVVSSPLKNEQPFNIKTQTRSKAFEKPNFYLPTQSTKSIPIIFVSENVAYQIFNEADKSLNEILESIDKKLTGNAFEFPDLKMRIELNFDREIISTQNVVGMIEGSDESLKDEFIVIGAHYDHVGLGYYGAMNSSDTGKIHNGADDNASGTSALIELAEAFSIEKPKRSLIFIAFSGEENGLLGSKFYVYYQPLKPLDKTIAMFNFDMIGRNEPELLWIGGAFYSDDIKKLIENSNDSTKFEMLYNTGLLNFASDQAPFLRKNIPSAFFFTGLHDDYHTPEDDYNKINFDKLERVTKLGFLAISNLANSNFKPVFKELSIDERKALVEQSLQRLKKFRKTKIQEGATEEQ